MCDVMDKMGMRTLVVLMCLASVAYAQGGWGYQPAPPPPPDWRRDPWVPPQAPPPSWPPKTPEQVDVVPTPSPSPPWAPPDVNVVPHGGGDVVWRPDLAPPPDPSRPLGPPLGPPLDSSLLAGPNREPTEFPGGVIANRQQVLERGRSPYLLREDLIIDKTGELVIEPGVELRFAPMAGLTVRGVLTARVSTTH